MILAAMQLAQAAATDSPLDWIEWIGNLGGTAVMIAAGWLVFTGRLRLGRELVALEKQNADLKVEKDVGIANAIAERDNYQRMLFEALKIGEQVTAGIVRRQ